MGSLRIGAARKIIDRPGRIAHRSVRHAHENSGVQGRRAHTARYVECANLMHLGLASVDNFRILGTTSLAVIPLVFLLKKVQPGQRAGVGH
jgi:hypothetical protein